ncbi:MAG: DUF1624 domain-containing protein [Firmicutes bacterium]|nr:DUF1624 domain-containing protein [Bacillota bacterium]
MDIEKKRYHLLDAIRGFMLMLMFFYHAAWDLVYIYDFKISWFGGTAAYIMQQFICCGFITLSGLCWRLSSNTKTHLKNGVVVSLCGLLITLVTLNLSTDAHIVFGILTFMGSAMLLMIPLDKLLRHIDNRAGALIALAAFVLCKNIDKGELAFGLIHLPEQLYKGLFMTYLGFWDKGFYSADYFGILPWIFMYIFGYFISPLLIDPKRKALYTKVPAADIIGKHSLLAYLLHQAVIYGILQLIFGLK